LNNCISFFQSFTLSKTVKVIEGPEVAQGIGRGQGFTVQAVQEGRGISSGQRIEAVPVQEKDQS